MDVLVNWSPVNTDNAIERVLVSLRLTEEIPARFMDAIHNKIMTEQENLGFVSARSVPVQGFSIKVENGVQRPPTSLEPLKAWDYEWHDNTGNRIHALSIIPNTISFETIVYSHWPNFFQNLKKAISVPFPMIKQVTDINAVNLQYWDRFIFNGEQSKAKPDLILSNVDDVLHHEALSGEKLWHINRGWFETFEDVNLLINETRQSQDQQYSASTSRRSISIHNLVERRDTTIEETNALMDMIDMLHRRSSMLFKELITDSAWNMLKHDESEA